MSLVQHCCPTDAAAARPERADGVDLIAAATSLSGAFWQMALGPDIVAPLIAAIHSFPTSWSMSRRVFSDC